jgi:CRP-like cAMP-binding protein
MLERVAHVEVGMNRLVSSVETERRNVGLRSQFIDGLLLSEREAIVRAATLCRFPANSIIVEQGRLGNRLFLLTSGRARHFIVTETGRKILLNWLVAGDIVGCHAALASPVPSLFGAETVNDCNALTWDRATIRSLIARYPKLMDNGLLIATSYFTWFLAAHEALACHPARQRLAHVLVTLAKGIGQKVPDGFELDVTNEELAYSANVTLFTVSRFLNQWQRQGILQKSRGKILLSSPERLFVQQYRNQEAQPTVSSFAPAASPTATTSMQCPRSTQAPTVSTNMSHTRAISLTNTAWKDFRSPLVEGFSASEQEVILGAAALRRYPAKTVVVEQGYAGNQVFLLASGRARHFFITEGGQKILLNWLVPGDLFGAYAGLFRPIPSLFGAETVKDCGALVWDRATIRSLIARFPRILDNGMSIAGHYLAWFLTAHVALTCHTARQKLAHVLVGLSKGIGQRVPNGFVLDVTNEELAYSANVSFFNVSRFVNQWQRQGILQKSRGKILLSSPERLFVHAV